jgi:hypothetical protein
MNWSFHGVETTKEQADKWRAVLDRGFCPFCDKPVAKRYSNQSKHLQACPSKPKTLLLDIQ